VSRTLSPAFTGHLTTHSHTRCSMLLLDLQDGTSIGITDHDKSVDFDIGDGTVTYDAGTGILASNVALSCGLDADNYEVTGPISEIVTLDAIIGGRFNRARTRLFEVNWKELSAGAAKILSGSVSEARVEGGKFVLEIRSDMDRYNQTVGRVITDQCDADFADGIQCFATPTTVVGTVTAATDPMHFTVSFAGAFADNFFNKGTVEFLTGSLAGPRKIEIESWTSTGAIVLFAPAAETPAIGVTATIKDGCGKSRADCMAHNAIEWFRGYPEVPGRRALMPAIPGQ
jgi:uncharacterized phage protein (TIGR02218 family)